MVQLTEETRLRLAALNYVAALHKEVTQEHGMPPLGTQNQAVDFILGDPELRRALTAWAEGTHIDEITPPLRRPPHDALHHRVRDYLERIPRPRVFPVTKELDR